MAQMSEARSNSPNSSNGKSSERSSKQEFLGGPRRSSEVWPSAQDWQGEQGMLRKW